MRDPEEIRRAIRHLRDAATGAPQDGEAFGATIGNAIADAMEWVLSDHPKFSAMMADFEKVDQLRARRERHGRG